MPECEICGGQQISYLFKKDGKDYYRCGNCKLERLSPKPADSDLESFYGKDYYRQGWGHWQQEQVKSIKKNTAQVLVRLIPSAQNKRILDCGCAAGYLLGEALNAAFLPYGIEISPVAVDAARSLFPPERIYQGFLEEAPFPAGFFYAIFMNGFLEHTKDPVKTVNRAFELLEPGGFLVITTPDTGSLSHKIMGSSWPHYVSEHLFLFNKENINLMLTKAGLKLISARKSHIMVTLDYLKSNFSKSVYKLNYLLIWIINLLPEYMRSRKMWFSLGQITILAQKNT
jgi:SAM-dependent methyltransferase